MRASNIIGLIGVTVIVLMLIAVAFTIWQLALTVIVLFLGFNLLMIVSKRARLAFTDWIERHE
jgi:hypothetical protein